MLTFHDRLAIAAGLVLAGGAFAWAMLAGPLAAPPPASVPMPTPYPCIGGGR